MKGPKQTNRYPGEFKIKAVQLADHPDILAKDVAEDLGVHPILLYRWRKEYREGKFKEDRGRKIFLETHSHVFDFFDHSGAEFFGVRVNAFLLINGLNEAYYQAL